MPEAAFLRHPGDSWSCGVVARHVAAADHHWTLVLQALREASPGEIVDLGSGEGSRWRELNTEADQRAGIPGSLPVPIPFQSATDAVEGLGNARSEFLATLTPEHFHVRMKPPDQSGAVSLRWVPEHVIEHDWAHTVQIASLAR